MRIKYEDEMKAQGELELTAVRRGDLVRFESAFRKEGDEADDALKEVLEGEIGEVVKVLESGELRVEAPCTLQGMGSRIYGEANVTVPADALCLLVNLRDPRLSSNRSMSSSLLGSVRGFRFDRLSYANARMIVASFLRDGDNLNAHRTAEFLLQDALSNSSMEKRAATPRDWLPLIMWSMQAMKADYPGEATPSIQNPRHVSWALSSMAQDLHSLLPAHELDYDDEHVQTADLAHDLLKLAEMTRVMSGEDWQAQLPDLASIMGDRGLVSEFARMTGQEPPRTHEEIMQQVTPPSAPSEAAPDPSTQEREDEKELRRIEEQIQRQERWDAYTREQEEAKEAPAPARERPDGVVSPFAEDAPPPSAEDEKVRIPIKVAPGFQGKSYSQTRQLKVFAEVDMPVVKSSGGARSKSGTTGVIQKLSPPDTIHVQTENGLEQWAASQVSLAAEYAWPVDTMSAADYRKWQQDLHNRRAPSRQADLETADAVVRVSIGSIY